MMAINNYTTHILVAELQIVFHATLHQISSSKFLLSRKEITVCPSLFFLEFLVGVFGHPVNAGIPSGQ